MPIKLIARLGSGAGAVARYFWNEATEPIQMVIVNGRMRSAPIDDTDIKALSDDDLAKLVAGEGVRAKELDEKLQKLTAALSVAVTVGVLVGQTILQGLPNSGLKMTAAILFFLAALLLIFGVLVGFDGMRPRPRYGYGARFLRSIAKGGVVARTSLEAAAVGFQRDNTIRANQASAAATSVRNGVLLFIAAILIGMLDTARGEFSAGNAVAPAKAPAPVRDRNPTGSNPRPSK
jgi:hypothetical protein